MADTMALENPQESFESTDEIAETSALGGAEVVASQADGDEKQVTSWMNSSGVSNFLAQPLVRRTIPALVGLFALLLFLLVYYWLNAEGSRTLYPNMSEVDRSEAFAQLQSANNWLHGFFNDSLNFLSFNTDAKPWPFNSNDEEESDIQEEVVEAEAVELSNEEPKAEDPA